MRTREKNPIIQICCGGFNVSFVNFLVQFVWVKSCSGDEEYDRTRATLKKLDMLDKSMERMQREKLNIVMCTRV